MFDGVLLELIFGAIFFESSGNKAKLSSAMSLATRSVARENTYLSSPITQVVHTNNIPSTRLVQIRQKRADDCTPKMPNVKTLGNIW